MQEATFYTVSGRWDEFPTFDAAMKMAIWDSQFNISSIYAGEVEICEIWPDDDEIVIVWK